MGRPAAPGLAPSFRIWGVPVGVTIVPEACTLFRFTAAGMPASATLRSIDRR